MICNVVPNAKAFRVCDDDGISFDLTGSCVCVGGASFKLVAFSIWSGLAETHVLVAMQFAFSCFPVVEQLTDVFVLRKGF